MLLCYPVILPSPLLFFNLYPLLVQQTNSGFSPSHTQLLYTLACCSVSFCPSLICELVFTLMLESVSSFCFIWLEWDLFRHSGSDFCGLKWWYQLVIHKTNGADTNMQMQKRRWWVWKGEETCWKSYQNKCQGETGRKNKGMTPNCNILKPYFPHVPWWKLPFWIQRDQHDRLNSVLHQFPSSFNDSWI